MANTDKTETAAPEKPAVKLDLTGAKLELVDDSAMAEAQRPRTGKPRARDAQQTALDEMVKQAHAKWVAAGRPEAFRKSPGGRVTVLAEQEEAITRAIRSSGNHLGKSIRFGISVKSDDGKTVTVYFRAADRKPKAEA